ncbi:hypothetical protein STRDD11_00590 [Streptococcus sp. DD11]|nr:hypothetical protein STRDD11_00590 [Streptococcus sp. DD11]
MKSPDFKGFFFALQRHHRMGRGQKSERIPLIMALLSASAQKALRL